SSVDSYTASLGTLNSGSSQTAGSITLPAANFNGLASITFRIVGSGTELVGGGATGSSGTGGPSSFVVNGTVTANGPTLVLGNNGTQTGTQNITGNTTGNVIAKSQVVVSGATASISSMVFHSVSTSTYVPADIDHFRLYRSTSSTYDGNSATPTGTVVATVA